MNVTLHAVEFRLKLLIAIQPVLVSLYGTTSLEGTEHGYSIVRVVVTLTADTVLTLSTTNGV